MLRAAEELRDRDSDGEKLQRRAPNSVRFEKDLAGSEESGAQKAVGERGFVESMAFN